jgi:hypothetical protein
MATFREQFNKDIKTLVVPLFVYSVQTSDTRSMGYEWNTIATTSSFDKAFQLFTTNSNGDTFARVLVTRLTDDEDTNIPILIMDLDRSSRTYILYVKDNVITPHSHPCSTYIVEKMNKFITLSKVNDEESKTNE